MALCCAELLTQTRVFAPLEPQALTFDKLLGRAPLPWEHTSHDAASGTTNLLPRLRALKRSVLACLHRDAAVRPSAREVLGRWNGLLDAETATATLDAPGQSGAAFQIAAPLLE